MFEVATVNPIGILVMLSMWGVVIWAITYVYMSERYRINEQSVQFLRDKVSSQQYTIEVLDAYIEETEKEIAEFERKYSHLIESYEEHMLDDVLQEDDFGLALMDAFNAIDKWSKR